LGSGAAVLHTELVLPSRSIFGTNVFAADVAPPARRNQDVKSKATPANKDSDLVAQMLADPAALDEGKSLFRGLCSGCHGGAARGGKGPDLTDDRWLHGHGTDADITGIIQNGVPGTTMKKLGDALKPEQIAKVIAFIRSLARAKGSDDWKPYYLGDAAEGEKLFFDPKLQFSCNKCHALNRRGGGIGPSLDRLAIRRSGQYVMESILKPSQDIDPSFEQVLVVTNDGKSFTGLRINETNFSVQIREQNGQFHSWNKSDLEQVSRVTTSLMPGDLAEHLTVKQLHDLFAFLMTLE
jgi:putative heme-binding domain-containing protein